MEGEHLKNVLHAVLPHPPARHAGLNVSKDVKAIFHFCHDF